MSNLFACVLGKSFRSFAILNPVLAAVVFYAAATLVFAPQVFSQQVALTFDDLPSHGPLPPGMSRTDIASSIIKALLAAHVSHVYGFVNAQKLQAHPEDIAVLKLWRAAGFPLGNHTFTHLDIDTATTEDYEKNIAQDEPLLSSLMPGNKWRWFRYPYLNEGDTLEKRDEVRAYLKQHGYHIAEVTLDFEDYAWNGPYARCAEKHDNASIDWLESAYMNTATEYIGVDRSMSKMVYGRDIKYVLLLHIGAFETIMLPHLLEALKSQGFKFIALPQAEKDRAYNMDPNLASKEGGSLIEQMMAAKHLPFPQYAPKPDKELDSICR